MKPGQHIIIDPDGKVRRIGLDEPDTCTLVGSRFPFRDSVSMTGERDAYIIVKVPGGSYWSGRGSRSYSGGHYVTYRIVDYNDESMFVVSEVCTVPIRSTTESGEEFIERYKTALT